jgi:hypothetical protein
MPGKPGLTVVGALVAVAGAALLATGLLDAWTSQDPRARPVPATVTAHQPVQEEMVTGSRGQRRVVNSVEVTLTYQDDGPRSLSLRRDPPLAARDFPLGSHHTAWLHPGLPPELEPPSPRHGLALGLGGLALVAAGLVLAALGAFHHAHTRRNPHVLS